MRGPLAREVTASSQRERYHQPSSTTANTCYDKGHHYPTLAIDLGLAVQFASSGEKS